jgi:hypothetical protein
MQNHVYCELLQPGMTEEEVSRALDEIGPHVQAKLDGLYPLPEGVAYSRNIYWRGSQHELTYFYSLWVGYDSNGGASVMPECFNRASRSTIGESC